MQNDIYSPLKVLHHPTRLNAFAVGLQPAPVHLQVMPSDYCNQDCSFCFYRQETTAPNELFPILQDGKRNHNPKRMMDVDFIIRLMHDAKDLGVKAITFTGGGEPTMNRYLNVAIDYCNSLGIEWALITNGTAIHESVGMLLHTAKFVRVSIDAGMPETYSRIRRVPAEQFYKALHFIKQMRQDSVGRKTYPTIGVGFVVTQDNYSEIPSAAIIARNHGADYIRFGAAFTGTEGKLDQSLVLEKLAVAKELLRGENAKSGQPFQIHDRVFNMETVPDYDKCYMQHLTPVVGADMNLYRCCNLAYSQRGLIGSLENQRLTDLWLSSGKYESMDALDPHSCPACIYNDKNKAIHSLTVAPPHVNFV